MEKLKNQKILILFAVCFLLIIGFIVSRVSANTLTSEIVSSRSSGEYLSTEATVCDVLPSGYTFALSGEIDTAATEIMGAISEYNNYTPKDIYYGAGAYYEGRYDSSGMIYTKAQSFAHNDSIKEKYFAIYKNVDYYDEKNIDVKMTVVDYDSVQQTDGNAYSSVIGLYAIPGNSVLNIRWVRIRYDFCESDDWDDNYECNHPVSVKGYTTYWDVDWDQGIILEDNNKGIYIYDSSNILKVTDTSRGKYVYDFNATNADTFVTTSNAFTETFEGTSITRTFTYGYPNGNAAAGVTQADYLDAKSGDNSVYLNADGSMFNNSVPACADIKLPKPTKTASKKNLSIGEEFTYTISQKIYDKAATGYYTNFKIEDTFSKALYLIADNVKIYNNLNEDVTNMFNISVSDDNKLTITLKNLENDDFYGHAYKVKVKTKILNNEYLASHRSGNKYVIPNHATVTRNDVSQNTNTVNVNAKIPVTVKYHVIGETPPADLTDPTPADENKYVGDSYTAKDGLTTTYKDKKCTFNGWYDSNSLENKYTTGTLEANLDLYGAWTCENLIETPSKSVSVNEIQNDEDFYFTITHNVPSITDSDYYYDRYVVEDEIENVFNIKDVTVTDKNNADVTNKFAISTDNSKVVISLINTNDSTFYNNTYTYKIIVNKKTAAILTDYEKVEGKYAIPNQAKITVNDLPKITAEVKVKIKNYNIKYHVIGETPPEMSALPADKQVYSGERYTVAGPLTTTYVEKKCTFSGWYLDEQFTRTWVNNNPVESDLDFYGSWQCDNVVNSVNKSTDINKIIGNREFTYEIYQTVPDLTEEYYYQSYKIEDILEDVLEIKNESKVKVYVSNQDVTDKFNVEIEGQKITITAKNTAESTFYNKEYKIVLTVNKKADADLTDYKQGDKYIIPNKAKLTVVTVTGEPETKETPIVNKEIDEIVVDYKVIGNNKPNASLTTPVPSNDTLLAGDAYDAKEGLTTKDNTKICTFKGWYTEMQLNNKYTNGTELYEDTTLYGAWECNQIVYAPKTSASISKVIVLISTAFIAAAVAILYILMNKKKA